MILGMQRIDGHLVLSPTDLTKHVACAHITTLDLQALDARASDLGATAADDALNLVFAKGLAHEARLPPARCVTEGLSVDGDRGASDPTGAAAEAATLAAMRQGVDVIYQATFFDGQWVGHADFLLRTDRPSDLGGWSYDIADTKLARRLKVPALLQMATYAARLATLQGVPPQRLTVVTGDKAEHPWRLVDVAPYARRRRAALLRRHRDAAPTRSRPRVAALRPVPLAGPAASRSGSTATTSSRSPACARDHRDALHRQRDHHACGAGRRTAGAG